MALIKSHERTYTNRRKNSSNLSVRGYYLYSDEVIKPKEEEKNFAVSPTKFDEKNEVYIWKI